MGLQQKTSPPLSSTPSTVSRLLLYSLPLTIITTAVGDLPLSPLYLESYLKYFRVNPEEWKKGRGRGSSKGKGKSQGQEGSRGEMTLEISEGEHSSQERAPLFPERDSTFHYTRIRGYREGLSLLVTDGFSSFLALPGERKGLISLSRETLSSPFFFTRLFFKIPLMEMLRHEGFFYLHAAGVVAPRQSGSDSEGAGYLFPGQSLDGKSTITRILVSHGFQYLSDDSLLLTREEPPPQRQGGKRVRALAFPEGDLPSPQGKRPGADLPSPKQEDFPEGAFTPAATPGFLLFPEIVPEPQSTISPISPLEAACRLIRSSPLVMMDPSLAPSHMKILTDLAEHSSSFSLKMGRDLLQKEELLLDLLP